MRNHPSTVEDYAAHIVHAKAYIKDAEDALGRSEWERAKMLLCAADTAMRKAIAWVDEKIAP